MKKILSVLGLGLLISFSMTGEAIAAMSSKQIKKEISGTYRFATNSGFTGRVTLNKSGSSKITYSGYGNSDIIKGDWGVSKGKLCVTMRNTSSKKRYGCFKVNKKSKGRYRLVGFGSISKVN